MGRDVLTDQPSPLDASSTNETVRFRIGVHSSSALLLVLSRLGWLDEAMFAEGILVDWVAYEDGGRTADLVAAARIEIGSATEPEGTPGVSGVVMVDGVVSGRPLLLASRGFVQQHPRLVAAVLQALEQAESWTLSHPDKASDLLDLARRSLDRALRTARGRQREPVGEQFAVATPSGSVETGSTAMGKWFVRYLDLETNRETDSQPLATRDRAITLARVRQLERCAIRSIVGPNGEEPWARVTLEP